MKAAFTFILIVTAVFSFPCIAFAQDTLTVDEAISTALQNNFSIQIVRKEVQIADNNNSYLNAGFAPSVIATGSQDNSISNTQQSFFDGRQRDVNGARANSLNGSVMMDWTIFQGANMFIAKNSLEELQTMEELEARMTIENTVASVIMVYYDIVSSQSKIGVISDALNFSRERMNLAEYKLQLGSASQIDIYQAAVDLNADSSAFLLQEGIVKRLKADLNILLGRDATTPFLVNESMVLLPDLQFEEILQKVQGQNASLFIARSNLTLAKLNTQYWKSQYFPRVSLYGGYNYVKSQSEVGLLQSNLNQGPVYGIRASFNIFNGMSNRRNLNNAKIQYQSSELQLKQAELQLKNDLYKIYTDYTTNLVLLNLEESNLGTARENLRIASEKYRLGIIDNIELRITQQNLMNAENRFVDARFRAKVAETELKRLSGEIAVF